MSTPQNKFLTKRQDIEQWLEIHGVDIDSCSFESDMTVNVSQSVDLSGYHLKVIPVKFGVIEGDFECADNELENLSFAPHTVMGSFTCYLNMLQNLEGGPLLVNGDYDCSNNQLVSLKGGPKEVGHSFYCLENKLSSLVGGPQKVGRDYMCRDNQLTTLLGAPQVVPNFFNCSNNQLTSFEYCPEVIGNLHANHNQISTLEFFPKDIMTNIIQMFHNKLGEEIEDITTFEEMYPYHEVFLKIKAEKRLLANTIPKIEPMVLTKPLKI